jgi:hypothetical protein
MVIRFLRGAAIGGRKWPESESTAGREKRKWTKGKSAALNPACLRRIFFSFIFLSSGDPCLISGLFSGADRAQRATPSHFRDSVARLGRRAQLLAGTAVVA